MRANRSTLIRLSASLLAFVGFAQSSFAATTPEAPMTLEEIRAKRQTIADELMVPSLKGIRGLGYVVVTPDEGGENLDKIVAKKLDQLNIPISPMRSLVPGFKPIDAIVDIKVHKNSDGNLMVRMSVIQWCSLLRSSKTKIRAITYTDSLYTKPSKLNETISELTNQFVINFLKANKVNANKK